MAINVSVQYNGGLLPDTILLTQCYHHREGLDAFRSRTDGKILNSHLNVLTKFVPYIGGIFSE